MTYSIWNDSCQQPMLIASSGTYTKLVQESTAKLKQPIDSIMSTLNDRAIGLSKCVNFIAALNDAKLMQQLSPVSALGYLREASIYSEQGKQQQAIDICMKGLTMAVTKDSDYATLQQAKIDAEQRHATRIDYIRQLPHDLVISTLIPMFIDDGYMDSLKPSPSLYVSHVWCDRIIQSLGGLRFLIGSEEDNTIAPVIEFARHIKALHVDQYTEGTWLGDLIGDHDFSSLQELQIDGFTTLHIGHFLSSLKSVSSTLTHFVADMESGPMLGIPEVVLTCPKLVSLSIGDTYDPDVSSLPMYHWPTITSLRLTFSCKPITCTHTIEIWKRFPSLKELELHPCPDIKPALVVSEYHPTIKSLHLCIDAMGIRYTYSDEGIHGEEAGVTKLTIGTIDFPEEICKDTTSVVKRHHNTLKHLEWDMDTSHDTENIDNIDFPRLTKLSLFYYGWEMIRNAPVVVHFGTRAYRDMP
ncbi:hypothetical protein O0I10_006335 [Lichtheimia ornata]|uniref:Uncharacterized protein n=1 Tax=Lichtheimia ornata TaxID=688661 RepID=A0AAD7V3Q7_9FUNG|nr:uncharacterized protein O0I10_006335 [Lichtheimia ornata]KAJ8658063.1 hypothetical protein O0I10_006335 [Lichtheimia ornata]